MAKSFADRAEKVSQQVKKDLEQQEMEKKVEIIVQMTKQDKQKAKNI